MLLILKAGRGSACLKRLKSPLAACSGSRVTHIPDVSARIQWLGEDGKKQRKWR